jgi:hypothetical protein
VRGARYGVGTLSTITHLAVGLLGTLLALPVLTVVAVPVDTAMAVSPIVTARLSQNFFNGDPPFLYLRRRMATGRVIRLGKAEPLGVAGLNGQHTRRSPAARRGAGAIFGACRGGSRELPHWFFQSYAWLWNSLQGHGVSADVSGRYAVLPERLGCRSLNDVVGAQEFLQ